MAGFTEDPNPRRKGVFNALPALVFSTTLLGAAASVLSLRPSADTLETAAQIGATLLVAYVIEASWLVGANQKEPIGDREFRLGTWTAVGAAAAISIGLSLVLAGRIEAHHWIWLDYLGLGWIASSFATLGGLIVMQPSLTHEWTIQNERVEPPS